jgi:hypothetical protein
MTGRDIIKVLIRVFSTCLHSIRFLNKIATARNARPIVATAMSQEAGNAAGKQVAIKKGSHWLPCLFNLMSA